MRILILLMMALITTACFKLELKPGNVVADTVGAGKDLYTTVKRKRNGEEERAYSHSIESESEELDTAKISQCRNQIENNIKASSMTLSKILSETSDVMYSGDTRKVSCQMSVLVKTK